jgi:hypothetical protein
MAPGAACGWSNHGCVPAPAPPYHAARRRLTPYVDGIQWLTDGSVRLESVPLGSVSTW